MKPVGQQAQLCKKTCLVKKTMRGVEEAFSFVLGSHAEHQHVVLADLGLRTNLSKLCVLAVSRNAIFPTMHCHTKIHVSHEGTWVNIIVIIILANTISMSANIYHLVCN